MALYCGLTANQRFGGIMGLSGFWFPNAQVSKEALDTPLYLSHGGNDFMIPAKLAEHSYKMIPNAKLNIVPHLDHGIDETQLEAMATCFHEWTHKSN
jgi:predicted esterase